MPILESVATAVPGNRVDQEELKDIARAVFSEHAPVLTRVLSVFENSGIRERYFAETLEWYLEPKGWRERMDSYVRHTLDLSEQAASRALSKASLSPLDVDCVMFVSTTGIATPSPDARLVNRMGLRSDVLRVPVWGLGCAGGVAGIARGRDLASAHPDSRVLVVSLELCSLAFQFGAFDKKIAVAASLFADGAAAAVVAGDEVGADGPRITASASHLFPDSERVMGWDVEDYGLGVVFSREIPGIVEREMRGLVGGFLKNETDGRSPERYLFHPGGAKVITAYEDALGLPPDALDDTRSTLRDYGNMSSPTVLFVVERALERKPLASGERALLSSLGPGFAGELVLLEGA